MTDNQEFRSADEVRKIELYPYVVSALRGTSGSFLKN